MKRVAQRWMVAQIAGLCLAVATGASAADVQVTDADRTYANFTRETAIVRQNEIRLEVSGIEKQDENNRLDLLGFPVKLLPGASVKDSSGGLHSNVKSLSGGIINTIATYGFAKNAEIGFIIPSYIQSLTLKTGGNKLNNSDIGDVTLYGKFQRSVAEHCSIGAGMELSTPNGPVDKGFGTGELGVKPFVSTRYQQGRVGVGANVGMDFYTHEVPSVLNYGAEVLLRVNATFAFRTEIQGRVFHQGGTRFNDLEVYPGLDVQVSDNLVIRPTGMANGTDTALDWGIGVGVAVSF